MPSVLYHLPSAQCALRAALYALCPLPSALCPLPSALSPLQHCALSSAHMTQIMLGDEVDGDHFGAMESVQQANAGFHLNNVSR